MSEHSALQENVEGILDAFFSTGAKHNKIYTLVLDDIENEAQAGAIAEVVRAVEGVKGLRVNRANATVYAFSDGSVKNIYIALEQAGFHVKSFD